jgi:hypothetical protein
VLGLNSPEWMLAMQVSSCSVLRCRRIVLAQLSPAPCSIGAGSKGVCMLAVATTSDRAESFPAKELCRHTVPLAVLTPLVLPPAQLALQACNRMSYVCVPLYETLGENAVEFILQHADVQLVFVEGCRMARMVKALREVHQVQAVVYWGPASTADIKVRELGHATGLCCQCSVLRSCLLRCVGESATWDCRDAAMGATPAGVRSLAGCPTVSTADPDLDLCFGSLHGKPQQAYVSQSSNPIRITLAYSGSCARCAQL